MKSETPPITQLAFTESDHDLAEAIAKRLGYTQFAYTSSSSLWGLFCMRDNPEYNPSTPKIDGCIIKTAEFGLMFVADIEDMHMEDLLPNAVGGSQLVQPWLLNREWNPEETNAFAAFVRGARKQKTALESGAWGHALFCNFQTPDGNGHGRCNCGVSDIITALSLHDEANVQMQTTPESKPK